MGKTVANLADFAVITADNPRFEDPLDIIADIERGYRETSKKYVVVPNRERAIEYAMERMERGDILLIAGKGGEKTQEIMGIKYPFEDNAIIERFVAQRTAERFL
jgi:UDP-N-acetylmuramoyl-L-alanyl-D-glutamate--2,6-diaminopimelate ligase